ncbi:cytochrome P450 [Schizopora paradoxa]|uniref:Cytochrome P450 n=1 Tax=Schizopora paradoxa TaxID=27342 RepID=A0A0H2R4A6_9AGAM|nr:cytochrome P450 [Schizopora paradoxa]
MSSVVQPLAPVVLLAAFVLWLWLRSFPPPNATPLPGPKGHLFSGNTHQIPKKEPWRTYSEWSRKYGPVFQFRTFGRNFIVLNSVQAVTELLEKRSSIYSDRPMSWMLFDLVGRGKSVFNISSLHPWHRRYRKLLHSGLNTSFIREHWPLLQEEASKLTQRLIEDSSNLEANIRLNAAAVIMRSTYGYTVSNLKDDFITAAEETSQITGKALAPGRWLVDSFPLLRFVPSWFPGADFKRQALEWKTRFDFLSSVPYTWVKNQIANGKFNNSFTSRLLVREDDSYPTAEEEEIINWCAGALYAGAADTTVSALLSFVMLMTLHPAIQSRAQAELDLVLGKGRQPSYTDLDSLPYLGAVFKEVLRFAPVGPLALPHRVIRNDEYLGFHIPKNSTIIPNVWAILHDEKTYPDPFTFDPERFLATGESHPKRPVQMDPRAFAFGFGARSCPGSQFAEKWMLINMASILANCTISPFSDLGRMVNPRDIEFTTGITSHIHVFECNVSKR